MYNIYVYTLSTAVRDHWHELTASASLYVLLTPPRVIEIKRLDLFCVSISNSFKG